MILTLEANLDIHYLSGSRADFGLMERCLKLIQSASEHSLGIIVTGQHTNAEYGNTKRDIAEVGFTVVGEIPVKLSGQSGEEMGYALSDILKGLIKIWSTDRPELVLLLGDRGEMLAGAIAAIHLGIPIAHIHGGECSGTIDENFRHAITKLSHIHFPATNEAKNRILKLGELAENVVTIGAPGLVGIMERGIVNPSELRIKLGLNANCNKLALCIFHPVVNEEEMAGKHMMEIVEATRSFGYAMVILRPNSDSGGVKINEYLNSLEVSDSLRIFTHFERSMYLDLMSICDLIIGNSSSGIIESASFGLPCVNVGTRQNGRLRNCNTFDSPTINFKEITTAINAAEDWNADCENLYGDGQADIKMLKAIDNLKLDSNILNKRMAF